MSRWIGTSPDHDHIGDVLEAADAWCERCFMGNGSLFGEEALWTPANILELNRRVQDDPIEGTGSSYFDKLEVQLKSARPEVIRLAAETLWFLFLLPGRESMKPGTKRERIKDVWQWSDSNLPDSDYLSNPALEGVANPDAAYQTRRPDEFDFLLRAVEQ